MAVRPRSRSPRGTVQHPAQNLVTSSTTTVNRTSQGSSVSTTLDPPPGVFVDQPTWQHIVYATTRNIRPVGPTVHASNFQNVEAVRSFLNTLFQDHVMIGPPGELLDKLAGYIFHSGLNTQVHMTRPALYFEHANCRIWRIPLQGFPGPDMNRRDHNSHYYQWTHASSPVGIIGILSSKVMKKAEDDVQYPTYGFFCSATYSDDTNSLLDQVIKRWFHVTKQTSDVVIGGCALIDCMHATVGSGGIWQEQQKAYSHGVAHGRRTGHWCIRPDVAGITDLWLVQSMI